MKMWLVGAGYWGSKLLTNLEKFGVEAHIIDIKKNQTIADISTLDPVMLATPLWQHCEQAKFLIKRGHDVYVEKPMAETAQQIDDIAQFIAPGQIVMVGHLFVYHPQMNEVRKLISDGIIGDVKHISSRRLNWGIYQTQTDPLLSLATHDISIIQAFTNKTLTALFAQSWNFSNNTKPDRVFFTGHCDSATTFDIDVSWYWPTRIRQTIVIGSTGQLLWDQDSNTVTITKHSISDKRALIDSHPNVQHYNYELTPLESELQHWITCVKQRNQPATGVSAARAVASVIDQVKTLL